MLELNSDEKKILDEFTENHQNFLNKQKILTQEEYFQLKHEDDVYKIALENNEFKILKEEFFQINNLPKISNESDKLEEKLETKHSSLKKDGRGEQVSDPIEQAIKRRTILEQNYGKIPPQVIDEEEKLLSLLFQNPDLLKKVPDNDIKNDGFCYKDHNGKILKSILRRRGNTNITTIAHDLREKNELDNVGGKYHLKKLMQLADKKDEKLFDLYYKNVQETFHQREIIRMTTDIQNEMFKENTFLDKIKIITGKEKYVPPYKEKKQSKEQSFVDLYRIIGESFIEKIPYPYKIDFRLDTIIDQAFNEIDATIKRKGKPQISTGIKGLDRFTHGIRQGRTGVVAGGSKIGKTTFMASLADNVMNQNGFVLYFTYETKPYELIQKLIAKRSQVNLAKFEYYTEDNPFTEEEQKRVFATKNNLKKLPFHVEGGAPDVDYIISNAKYKKILHPNMSLVVIDGIQAFIDQKPDKMTLAEFYYNTVSRFNKEISEYLGVQTIIAGQLKRIGKVDKMPRHVDDIADCKGLGDIIDWAFGLYQKDLRSPMQGIPLAARQDEKPEKPFNLHAQRNLGYIGEMPLPRYNK